MSISYIGALSVPELFPPTQQITSLAQAAITDINAYIKAVEDFYKALTGIHESLDYVVDALLTVEGGLDFVLDGLIPIKLSATLEFQGALKAMANLSFAVSNPLANALAAVSAMATAMASLKASISLGMPTVSAELGVQLSALAAVQAAAAAKMAGIQALITATSGFLGPLVYAKELIATLKLTLSLDLPPLSLGALDNIVVALATHMQGPGVYAYSGSIPYSELQGVLGPPPGSVTGATNLKAIILLVDEGANPSTWVNLKYMMCTTP